MHGHGLATSMALITDGRFSGINNGCSVGHISTESAESGLLALVRNGDKITIDVYKNELTLHVIDEELEKRRIQWNMNQKFRKGIVSDMPLKQVRRLCEAF